ncbi:MAG: hypothetical protein Q9176_002919 [Flavoplaca citrina]
MSWAPRYDYSPEAGSPTEEFFLDGDYIEPMGSPRITVGIQETMQLQRSLEPNFNGSQAWSPFVDAVSDSPVGDHMPSLNGSNFPLIPYGNFYQESHELANTLPMRTMAGPSIHSWQYSHTTGNGSLYPYSGSPLEPQEYPEVNQVENAWTGLARPGYGNAPSSHLGYNALAQNLWHGVIPGSPQNRVMPGLIIDEIRKYPRSGHLAGYSSDFPWRPPSSRSNWLGNNLAAVGDRLIYMVPDVDGSAPPAPAIREADAYRHITPGPRSIQAIPLQNGVHSRATEASFRAIQPIRIPMNALTPGNRMLADNHIPQVDAQQVFDQKMAPTRKRKRRQFSPTEKEHIKRVRKLGACPECRLKKCKV